MEEIIKTNNVHPQEHWHGIYKGFNFKIVKWIMETSIPGKEEQTVWNYYINIFLDRIPEENNPKSFWLKAKSNKRFKIKYYDYYEHPVIGTIPFYGGITFYQKHLGVDGNSDRIEIGCDYNHIWDKGKVYTKDVILSDIKETIDALRKMIPDYKYRCNWDGSLHLPKDGMFDKHGQFLSYKNYRRTGTLRSKNANKFKINDNA